VSALLRLPRVIERTGFKRSAIYDRVRVGLLPRPIKLGTRASAWPSDEIDACNDAIIKGKSPDEIRSLVTELQNRRQD
jgi:prophage regulatory protein